jgi:O-antigen ligase
MLIRYLMDPRKRRQAVELIGTAGLLIFALSAFLSTSGVSIGLGLLLVAILLNRSVWPSLRRDPVIMLFVASTIYLVLRTVWAIWEFPDSKELQGDQAWDWFRLWLFLCVAWWINGDLKRLKWVLLLPLAGLLVGAMYYLSGNLSVLWSGERTGFHLRIIAFGLYSSTIILGLLLLAPRIWGKRENLAFFALRVCLWLIPLVLMTHGLIIAQSRGAWLAAVVVIPPMIVVRYLLLRKRRGSSPWRRIGLAAIAVILLAILIQTNLPTIRNRISQEEEMFSALYRGDFDDIPTLGFGVRVQTFRFGMEKWLERPIFGWGPGSTEYLISHSNRPNLMHPDLKREYAWLDHLHITYLEVLVRFGLVGAFLILTVIGFLLKGLWNAYREMRLPADYALFLAGAFALTAVWSLSDFRLLHTDWRSYWILLGGSAYAFRLPSADHAEHKATPDLSGD